MDDAETVVRAVYEAFAARDLDAFTALVDREVELVDPDLPGGGSFHGLAGVRRFAEEWFGAFEELDVQIERLVPVGGHIVACVHQRGRSTTGVPVELRDGHVWTVADGKVTRVEFYLSHDAALGAATGDVAAS